MAKKKKKEKGGKAEKERTENVNRSEMAT